MYFTLPNVNSTYLTMYLCTYVCTLTIPPSSLPWCRSPPPHSTLLLVQEPGHKPTQRRVGHKVPPPSRLYSTTRESQDLMVMLMLMLTLLLELRSVPSIDRFLPFLNPSLCPTYCTALSFLSRNRLESAPPN